jgi:hypothetical protein
VGECSGGHPKGDPRESSERYGPPCQLPDGRRSGLVSGGCNDDWNRSVAISPLDLQSAVPARSATRVAPRHLSRRAQTMPAAADPVMKRAAEPAPVRAQAVFPSGVKFGAYSASAAGPRSIWALAPEMNTPPIIRAAVRPTQSLFSASLSSLSCPSLRAAKVSRSPLQAASATRPLCNDNFEAV